VLSREILVIYCEMRHTEVHTVEKMLSVWCQTWLNVHQSLGMLLDVLCVIKSWLVLIHKACCNCSYVVYFDSFLICVECLVSNLAERTPVAGNAAGCPVCD
jgi:hypothetical protein